MGAAGFGGGSAGAEGCAGADGCTGAAAGGGTIAEDELRGTVTVTTLVAVIVATSVCPAPFCPSPSAGCAIGTAVAVVLQVLLLPPPLCALELAPGAPTKGGDVDTGADPPISVAGALDVGPFWAGGVGFAG